jgi:hypothetical protein
MEPRASSWQGVRPPDANPGNDGQGANPKPARDHRPDESVSEGLGEARARHAGIPAAVQRLSARPRPLPAPVDRVAAGTCARHPRGRRERRGDEQRGEQAPHGSPLRAAAVNPTAVRMAGMIKPRRPACIGAGAEPAGWSSRACTGLSTPTTIAPGTGRAHDGTLAAVNDTIALAILAESRPAGCSPSSIASAAPAPKRAARRLMQHWVAGTESTVAGPALLWLEPCCRGR